MSKLYLLPILALVLIITGCGTRQIDLLNNEQKIDNPPLTQNSYWCTDPMSEKIPEDKMEVWVSSDYYQGMNHGPTVRHICRGEKELFYLLMDWDDKADLHTGRLIVVTPTSTFPPLAEDNAVTFPIFSVNKDPEVKIIENQNKENPRQVSVSVDEKIIIYDEVNNVFRSKNDQDAQTAGQSLEHVIYNILKVEKKDQKFYFTIASSHWLSSDKAIEVALKETGCSIDRIRDGACAPSLNNGFYISRKFSPKMTLLLADNAEIFIFKESKLTKTSAETFFNLFTQTDTFATEGQRTPFLIEIKDGKINRVESQYTP